MDLQEKRRLDVARQMARMKERARRARPWRSIFSLLLAIAAIVAVKWLGVPLHAGTGYCAPAQSCPAGYDSGKLITGAGTAAFLAFGVAAVLGLSGKTRSVLAPGIGSAHASVVRYALVLIGAVAVILITLNLVNISVGQLIVGGALTGVLIGIAAQQALGNVFAGLVLMFARPFSVGDRVWIRSGALSGTLEGTVIEISITYVRLDTSDGLLSLPNSQVLAAVVGPARPPAAQPTSLAAWQPGNPDPVPTDPVSDGPARRDSVAGDPVSRDPVARRIASQDGPTPEDLTPDDPASRVPTVSHSPGVPDPSPDR